MINKKPFFIENNFIVGFDFNGIRSGVSGCFISDAEKKIKIEEMTKAIIIEEKRENEDNKNEEKDDFLIINKNLWDNTPSLSPLDELKIGEIFLPQHSAIVNFLNPSPQQKKEKIVSCLDGVNINIYSQENYIDNCIHEIGHLFWRNNLTYKEKQQFKNYYKYLKPSAIYEYEWEKANEEEMFCTIYKWYLKSILINKSFYNILEYEETGGLKLLQEVFDRIVKNKITNDIWTLNESLVTNYLNPKFDKTTGKRIVKKGLFDEIKDMELPEKILNDINKFQNGNIFINLNKAVIPIKNNKINFYYKMEKAKKIKPVIYMDMDGVITDFDSGYKNKFNRDIFKDDSFTINQFCLQQPHFFRELPINQKGLELFNFLKNKYNIVFLTTPMKNMEYCKIDKIEWIRENIGDYDVLFSDNKGDYVIDKKSILIDDMEHNLNSWTDAGGTSIRFPQKIEKIMNTIEKVFNPEKEIKKIKKQINEMDVNINPTQKQKETGIYKKGTINFKDLTIKIENPKNSIRWGFNESGKKWITKMKCHYGYITGTEGADFDPVDCFLGDKLNASRAFVVNQGKDGMFDEHKIMLGFENIEEARKAYFSNYEKNWNGLISIKQTNTKKLRDWLKNGNLTEPFF